MTSPRRPLTLAMLAAACALAFTLSGCSSLKRDTTVLVCFGPCSNIPAVVAVPAPAPAPAAASAPTTAGAAK